MRYFILLAIFYRNNSLLLISRLIHDEKIRQNVLKSYTRAFIRVKYKVTQNEKHKKQNLKFLIGTLY